MRNLPRHLFLSTVPNHSDKIECRTSVQYLNRQSPTNEAAPATCLTVIDDTFFSKTPFPPSTELHSVLIVPRKGA